MTATRPAIDAWLRSSGLRAQRVRLVADVYCEVWRIALVAHPGLSGDVALRIYPGARTDAAPIEAELAWLAALADEGLHVPRPVPDPDGRLLRTWQPDAAIPPRHAVLLTWLGGRMHDRGLTPERLRRVGAFAARLHRTSARLLREGAIATQRSAYDCDLQAWAGGDRPGAQALGPSLRAASMAAAREVAARLSGLPADGVSCGFVHGDLHQWNLLFARDVAGAIDFSDCGHGHVAMDLASPLQFLRHWLTDQHDHRAQYPRLREALMDGYAQVGVLPHDIEAQVDLYIVARLFMSLDWILDDWPDAAHRPWRAKFLQGCEGAFRDFVRSSSSS